MAVNATMSDSEPSKVPDGAVGERISTHEIDRKQSRFIAHVYRVNQAEQIKTIQAELKASHPKASHVCIAATLDGQDVQSGIGLVSSDDGEPSGTAGKPMLNVLLGQEFSECLVAVVRYFGGTKLGTGGLVRAYADAAKEALRGTPIELVRPHTTLRFDSDYADQSAISQALHQFEVAPTAIENTYDARIHWSVVIAAEMAEALYARIVVLTNARVGPLKDD